MPLRLRPLDEVGDDQEVAGELHLRDDVDLVGEPLFVVLAREARRRRRRGEPLRRGPASAWRAQLGRFERCDSSVAASRRRPATKRGRIGLRPCGRKAQRLAISMVLSSASGRSANSSAICVGGLEVVLARQAAAVVLDDVAALGDAQQRVVRLVVVGRGEIDFVGGDDRQLARVGELEQLRLDVDLVLAGRGAGSRRRAGRRRSSPAPSGARRRASFWPSRRAWSIGPSGPPVSAIRPSPCASSALDLDVRRLVVGGSKIGAARRAS